MGEMECMDDCTGFWLVGGLYRRRSQIGIDGWMDADDDDKKLRTA